MSATIRLYVNGLTMGVAGRNPNPPKRGEIKGWTAGAVRRHTRFLYSIDAPQLEAAGEVGYALTLTLRRCPTSDQEWIRIREAWLQRIRRLGAVRTHWVVEWQRRGVPHLHAAAYFPDDRPREHLVGGRRVELPLAWLAVNAWMEAAGEWEPAQQAQHFDRISGALGWLKYLSKHASRGVKHYQRTGRPEGWEKTGRLWGRWGSWPELAPVEWAGTIQEFHRLRRLVRAWRIADARAAGDVDRQRFARRMLACPDRRLSAVRGVSDWIPEPVALRLAEALWA